MNAVEKVRTLAGVQLMSELVAIDNGADSPSESRRAKLSGPALQRYAGTSRNPPGRNAYLADPDFGVETEPLISQFEELNDLQIDPDLEDEGFPFMEIECLLDDQACREEAQELHEARDASAKGAIGG